MHTAAGRGVIRVGGRAGLFGHRGSPYSASVPHPYGRGCEQHVRLTLACSGTNGRRRSIAADDMRGRLVCNSAAMLWCGKCESSASAACGDVASMPWSARAICAWGPGINSGMTGHRFELHIPKASLNILLVTPNVRLAAPGAGSSRAG